MAPAVNGQLTIDAGDWEFLAHGEPEERACFGALGIRRGDRWLTQAEDRLAHRLRPKPYLSAYALAQFLAWNWWRIRWEPRANSVDWRMAHSLAAIGGGYVWPDLVFDTDGLRIALLCRPTDPRPAEPLRYVESASIVVDGRELEQAMDALFDMVLNRLREEGVGITNLHAVRANLQIERTEPARAEWRRLEALLGCDPDEGNKRRIKGLVDDGKQLGRDAIAEIAADHASHRASMTGRRLADIALTAGIDWNRANALQLRDLLAGGGTMDDTRSFSRGTYRRKVSIGLRDPGRPFRAEEVPADESSAEGTVPAAWQQGILLATAVRRQLGLTVGALDDQRLCEISGLPRSAVDDVRRPADLAFALDDTTGSSRIVLRSRSSRGRRLEMVRLLSDRLTAQPSDRLFPVTRTSSYRQKYQRAFAAELLCPTDGLIEVLGKAPTSDDIEDAALHFQVPGDIVVAQLLRRDRPIAAEFGDHLNR
jgi:hypothetical protein